MMAALQVAWGMLTSRLAGPIAAGVSVVLLVLLLIARTDAADAHAQAERLRNEITRPNTGWAAQLERCKASRITLDGQLADQSRKVADFAARLGKQQADAAQALAKVQRGREASEARVRQLLATPLTGNVCADLNAADAALLRSLP